MKRLLCLLLLDALTQGLTADPAKEGPFKSEPLAFPDLVDASRAGKSKTDDTRPRLFKPRREQEAKSAGRPVPIKVHLPLGDGPFPVVVVSHGAGGDWDTHLVQAKHLASHGYAVLCLEHVGSNRERMGQGLQMMKNLDAMIHDSEEVMARPKDVSFALDRAAEWNRDHPRMRGKLDLGRVGMMGHSFGAYTTMVICGTLDKQQNGSSAQNRRDGFMLWPRGGHAFVWISDAAHLDFTDSTGSSGKARPSKSRSDVQPLTKAATLLFLDQHLQPSSKARLSEQALTPYRQGAVKKVEVTFR